MRSVILESKDGDPHFYLKPFCCSDWIRSSRAFKMPFKDQDGNDLPTCDVTDVYKDWKLSGSVRMVALRSDRLFESSKPNGSIKFSIVDAVHNQYVLKPLLERMAQHDHHPVPYVKELAREKPFLSSEQFFCWGDFVYESQIGASILMIHGLHSNILQPIPVSHVRWKIACNLFRGSKICNQQSQTLYDVK